MARLACGKYYRWRLEGSGAGVCGRHQGSGRPPLPASIDITVGTVIRTLSEQVFDRYGPTDQRN